MPSPTTERPAYLSTSAVRDAAFTATPEVRDDIANLLGLTMPTVIVSGFNRPNINLDVRLVAGNWEEQDLLSD